MAEDMERDVGIEKRTLMADKNLVLFLLRHYPGLHFSLTKIASTCKFHPKTRKRTQIKNIIKR
jgi:hypothetical protein